MTAAFDTELDKDYLTAEEISQRQLLKRMFPNHTQEMIDDAILIPRDHTINFYRKRFLPGVIQ